MGSKKKEKKNFFCEMGDHYQKNQIPEKTPENFDIFPVPQNCKHGCSCKNCYKNWEIVKKKQYYFQWSLC